MAVFSVNFTSVLDDYKKTYSETFTFSDDEIATLKRFCSETRRLAKYRLFGDAARISMGMNYDQQSGVAFSVSAIDDEAWSAAMHLLRPLTLKSAQSRHNFFDVRQMLLRQVRTEQFKAHLVTIKDGFQGKFMPMQFSHGVRKAGQKLKNDKFGRIEGADTMESIYEKWLHAFEHHDDAPKQLYFEKLFRSIPRDFVQALIFHLTLEKMGAMLHLMNVIEGIIGSIHPRNSDENEFTDL